MSNARHAETDQGTAAAYARNQRCFHDHQTAPFRFRDQLRQIQSTIQPVQSDGLILQPGLVAVSLPAPDLNFDSVDESDELLTDPYSYLEDSAPPTVRSLLHVPCLNTKYLPRETLDLGYDFMKDIQQYSNNIRSKRGCNISEEWLPLSPINIEKDEGLPFSSASSRWQSLALHALDHEEIETSDEAMKLIRFAECSDALPPNQQQWTNESDMKKSLRSCPEPVSPPMSPIIDAGSDFIPGPDVTIIDLTSEPNSPINSSTDQLQQDAQNGCLDSEPAVPSTRPSSPPLANLAFAGTTRRKTPALKVDVPIVLSSPVVEQDGLFLGTMNFDKLGSEESHSPSIDAGNFFGDALMEIVKDHHYRTMQMVELERLNSSDSLLRVRVPVLNFEISTPEHGAHLLSPEAQFAWLKSEFPLSFLIHANCCLARLGSSLRWTPVPPGTGRVSLEEDLGQLGFAGREYLTLENPALCSANYVTKTPSLSVLRAVQDEEIDDDDGQVQLDCEEVSVTSDITRTSYDPLISSRETCRGSLLVCGLAALAPSLRRKAIDETATLLPNSRDSSATSKLLSDFIELRHPKKPRLTNRYLRENSEMTKDLLQRRPPTQAHPIVHEPLEQASRELEKVPAPGFDVPQDKCRFIVSLGVSRSILSSLEKAWPHAELIDWDFTRYNTVTWSPGSAKRREVLSSLSHEADLALSPSAGIIIANLLKVKQKPLPGSTVPTPLRDRVQRVSEKYEFLIILVSEANSTGEYIGSPSDSDLAAYADFVRFTTALQTGVMTYYISGAEATLTKWILSLMCRFAPQASSLGRFLESRDTTWAIFFRRAGMNIFAAQVLSGTLLSEFGNLGLAQFLAMDAEERISRYSQMMGGQRVMGQVCRLLDREWV
ncbi:Fc.00g091970.m01.CDS01 [Cosmosporella sp. VM-42]